MTSGTYDKIRELATAGDVRVSDHGYGELAADGILVAEVVAGVSAGMVLEDYPAYPKGSCVLVLQRDGAGRPIHVVWGIPRGKSSPAVIVTGYRPDPDLWADGLVRRKA